MKLREEWEKYKNRLEYYGYSEQDIVEVYKIRELNDLCEYEQFEELVNQGLAIKTRKLKKKRHLYVDMNGRFMYLCHWHKKFNYCGYFKTEE